MTPKLPHNKQKTLKHIQKARRANDAIGDRRVRQQIDEALTLAYITLVRSDKTID